MMKRILLTTAALFALAIPSALAADKEGHDTHAGHASMARVAHEEVVDGVKVTFSVQTMADAMKGQMPKGIRETHHIAVLFRDAKSGRTITEGTARIKVQNPDKSGQVKDLQGMHGHFGADFEMATKGRYGIMCKFLLKGDKPRQVKFWYSSR
jgi:opacity protein-like surface antigen